MSKFTIRTVLKGYEDKTGRSAVLIDVWYEKRHYRKPLSIKLATHQLQNGIVTDHPEEKVYNAIIHDATSQINLALLAAERRGELTPDFIKTTLGITGHRKDPRDFYAFISICIDDLQGKLSPNTLKGFRYKLESLKEFRPQATFQEITSDWITAYTTWLRTEKKVTSNTIYDRENFLHRMLTAAVPRHLATNPMDGMPRTRFDGNIPHFLTDDQVQRMTAFVTALKDGSMKRAGIYFLADMEIGLRVSDLEAFDPEKDIVEGRFVKKTKKGKTIVALKVSDRLQGYIDYIRANPFDMSKSTYDRRLKQISDLLGFEPRLKSHVARHTLGRRLARANVNIKIAQKILGHKNIASTEVYYHIDDSEVDAAMDAIA